MIYDIKDFLKKFFSSRLFVLAACIIILFAIVIERLFSLQIVNGADYQENFTMLIQKNLSIDASRGNIYDCNGNLIAYNQLAYSVVISDNGEYENRDTKRVQSSRAGATGTMRPANAFSGVMTWATVIPTWRMKMIRVWLPAVLRWTERCWSPRTNKRASRAAGSNNMNWIRPAMK